MSDYILFSPLGTTDPISNYRDGALLHICRKYRPSNVVLYYSAEMLKLKNTDNRFCMALELLGKKTDHKFKISEISRPELTEVHIFDVFYSDFGKILHDLKKKHPGKKLLLNISSGTPAMKSALNVLAALSGGEYTAVQVSSPQKSSNPKRDDINEFDLGASWDCNEDNDDSKYNDRCGLCENMNLIAHVEKEIMINLLKAYDYSAAKVIASEIKDLIGQKGYNLICAAESRLRLDFSGVDRLLHGTGINIPFIGNLNERSIFEFLLWLQVKLFRCDYADFIRGLTPAIFSLFELVIINICGIKIDVYYSERSVDVDDGKILSRKLLSQDAQGIKILSFLDQKYSGGYKENTVCSAILLNIIRGFCNDRGIINIANKLRSIEADIRNLTAHEIVSVTPEWIQLKCGCTPRNIMDDIRQLTGYVMPESRTSWNSYDKMNELIIKNLETR